MGPKAAALVAAVIDRLEGGPPGTGRPPLPTLHVVEALRFFVREGVQWRGLRATAGRASGATLRRRLGEWAATALLRRVHLALIRMVRAGPEPARWDVVVDSCSVRAKRGGALTGPNPTDRGKAGTKYHVVVATDGLPLGAVPSAANVHDTRLFRHLLRLAQVACAAIGKLRAGLSTAAWISVDDTGARHRHRNAVCTQLGNDHFAAFATTASKSRLNFLEVLRAGYRDYVVNAEALAYMRQRDLAGPVIAQLAAPPVQCFPDEVAWMSYLERFGITALAVTPDSVKIATEGAVWGSIQSHGLLPNTVILSDGAGQFALDWHALCWMHAERLVYKLDMFTDRQDAAQQLVRTLIWWFYADLKAYRREPDWERRRELRARFDRIFRRRTGFVALDRLLRRLHTNKAELLLMLDRPEVPLHTNGSSRDLRPQVIKRKISGGTRSEPGRACRDAFLGLLLTCAKLGISFWDYFGHRLGVPGVDAPYLPDLVRLRSAPA